MNDSVHARLAPAKERNMSGQLSISTGQHSDKGRKGINQDFHGIWIPLEPLLTSKGIAAVLADGISSSPVSHVASETAVKSFLGDYYCTSEAWSVRKSAEQVLNATNSWLNAQTRHSEYRYDPDKGYVCTLSAVVLKSMTAHILHVGDSRVYLLRGKVMELLTKDHRHWVSHEQSHLSRALGVSPELEVDYLALPIEKGDIFLLVTDGVHEYVAPEQLIDIIDEYAHDLDMAAHAIAYMGYAKGSADNLTAQLVRVDELPSRDSNTIYQQMTELPFPPLLEARMMFDGYQIIRELHASSRSHVYLAVDSETNTQVVIKTPSIDLRGDPAYLERFLMEEWIARRIDSAHVLKPC